MTLNSGIEVNAREGIIANIVGDAAPLPKFGGCDIVRFIANKIEELAARDTGLFGKNNFAALNSDVYLLKAQFFGEVTAVLYYKGKEVCELDTYILSGPARYIAEEILAALKKVIITNEVAKVAAVLCGELKEGRAVLYNVIEVTKCKVGPEGIDNWIVEYRDQVVGIVAGSSVDSFERLSKIVIETAVQYILTLGIDCVIK